jgi:hypothetical protein
MNIYVGQFDYFWKLSEREWLELCTACADGAGYDLAAYRQLKHKPRFLVRNENGRSGYWSTRQDVIYVEPLDWYAEDFAEHLADISQVKT